MSDSLQNDIVITDNNKFKRVIRAGQSHTVNLPNGTIPMSDIADIGIGGTFSIKGKRYYIFACDVYDYVMTGIKRETQLIYPKDAGYILLRLDIFPGKFVGEAGTGSGGLTVMLSRAVGAEGRVYTYEKNANLVAAIEKNLQPAESYANVHLSPQSLEAGINEKDLDAFFLDVRDPSEVLGQVYASLKPSGHLGVLVPTVNQMTKLLWAIREHPFLVTEVSETYQRTYKANPSRFRPQDRMIGHTGYLLFARALQESAPTPPEGQ